jgi:FkbM family methyltransferase
MKFVQELLALLRCIWLHPANRGHKTAAIGRFLSWQLSKRVLHCPVIIKTGDRRFIAHPDSPYSSLVIYNRLPDWDELGLLGRILQCEDCFLDIGANVGFYSVFAASFIGPAGQIFSFEPNPVNVKVLEQQKALNALAYWTIIPCALGARPGMVDFSAPTRDTGSVQVVQSPSSSQLSVSCKTLDLLLDRKEEMKNGGVAKMDVEGYEMEVLQGAQSLFSRKAIWLWVYENNPAALLSKGSSSRQLLAFFRSVGYQIFRFSEDRAELELFEKLDAPDLCNLIACSDIAKLRTRLSACKPA